MGRGAENCVVMQTLQSNAHYNELFVRTPSYFNNFSKLKKDLAPYLPVITNFMPGIVYQALTQNSPL